MLVWAFVFRKSPKTGFLALRPNYLQIGCFLEVLVSALYKCCVYFLGFDIRIPPSVDLVAFEEKIKSWCSDAGDDVTCEFLQVSI